MRGPGGRSGRAETVRIALSLSVSASSLRVIVFRKHFRTRPHGFPLKGTPQRLQRQDSTMSHLPTNLDTSRSSAKSRGPSRPSDSFEFPSETS